MEILLLFFVLFFGFFVALFVIKENKNKKPKASIQYDKSIYDTSDLFSEFKSQGVLVAKDENHLLKVSEQERGFVLGISGARKTSFLFAQIIDWMESGRSFVVTDIKPEIWAVLHHCGAFKQFGYTDIVINPTDPKSHKYNAFDDIDENLFVSEIVELVEILVGSESAFSKGAKTILRALLIDLKEQEKHVSLVAVRKYLNSYSDVNLLINDVIQNKGKAAELARQIKRSSSNERYISSCFAELDEALKFLDSDVIANNISVTDYSLREELQKPRRAVFLQFEQVYKKQLSTLFGFTISHVLRILQTNHKQRDDVFIGLDEIINSAKIPDLQNKLQTVRSAKMPLYMYMQNIAGLEAVYGKGSAEEFLSACSLKVCYRVNDNKTAIEFSNIVGLVEVTETTINESKDKNNRTVKTPSQRKSKMKLIEPSQFFEIPDGQALLIYKGKSAILEMPSHISMFKADFNAQYERLSDIKD